MSRGQFRDGCRMVEKQYPLELQDVETNERERERETERRGGGRCRASRRLGPLSHRPDRAASDSFQRVLRVLSDISRPRNARSDRSLECILILCAIVEYVGRARTRMSVPIVPSVFLVSIVDHLAS